MIQKNKPPRKDAERLFSGYFEEAGQTFDERPDVSRRHLHNLRDFFVGVTVNQFHFHDLAVAFGVDVFADQLGKL